MHKPNVSQITKSVRAMVTEHSPEILTGIGIAGMVTTTILAIKATPKAMRLLDETRACRERENESHMDDINGKVVEPLTKAEVVKITWKCYIPTAVTGVMSIACIIGANSVNVRRNAALATAYTLSETALKEYREKVVETIGEKKEQAVQDSIAKDKVERDPVSTREVIITEKGNTLCYDAISGRYFKSDIDKIKGVICDLNLRLMDEMYISLNELYYDIGLRAIDIGDDIGWNVDQGKIDVRFSSQLADDGTPCLVISYSVVPRYDYRHLM